jgi:hypothetical protein
MVISGEYNGRLASRAPLGGLASEGREGNHLVNLVNFFSTVY